MKLFKKISVIILAIVAMFSFSMFFGCDCSNGDGGDKPPVVAPKQDLITFDYNALNMVVGDEIVLPARTTDSSTIISFTYSSSNPDVASVDKVGRVVANGQGTATIKAQYGSEKAECVITVTHGNLLPQISIDNVENKLVVPKTVDYALNPYVTFNNKKFYNATFTYEQNNNNISIDQAKGTITGVNLGETVVTVKASWDGVSGIATMSKTFTVKVTNTVQMYVNNGATSSVTLYNKVLNKLYGEQTSTDYDFVVTALDQSGNALTPTIEVVSGTDVVVYDQAEQMLKGQGKLGQAKVKLAVAVDSETFELFVDVTCERAVGDYMTAGGDEYNTVDFNTLTGNLDINAIFGEDTTIVNAYDGRLQLRVEDNKIVDGIDGDAFNEDPEKKIITIYDNEVGYNVEIVPYVFKGATTYANNYFFSSYDGALFDNDMVAVDPEDIFGDGKLIKEAYVQTAEGQLALRISANGINLLGAEQFEDPASTVKFAVASDDNMYYFEVAPYTLIIDEMVDFDYFIVKDGTWSFKPNKYTINAGLEWDGNYVLANDIDATEYYSPNAVNPTRFQGQEKTFTYLNWLGTAYQEAHFSTTLGIKAREDAVATIGYTGKGFTGVFDGRGHIIRNYSPTVGGLFQIINGGVIKNLGFVNATPGNNAGILCGTAFNNAVFENIFIHGNLQKGLAATYAGAYLTSGIGHTVKMHNVVVVDEFNNINYGAGRAGMIDADNGSTYGQGADWTDVYFVTPLPVKFEKSGTSAIAKVDAGYIDGAEYKNEAITVLNNASRFTSLEKMYEVNKANNVDLSSFNEYWELLGGYVPIFKNALTFDMLSINVGMLPATTTGNMLTVDDVVEVKATYYGAPISSVSQIIINSGAEFIEIVDGYKIKGVAKGTASLTAKYVQDGQELSVDFTINVVPTISNYSEEFYYSAYDGTFFQLNQDGTYSPVEDALSQIFGKPTTYNDLFVAYNPQGQSLAIDKENEKILGVSAGKGGFADTYFDIYTATEGKRVNVKAATLIIDEAEDFEYFTLKKPVDYHITTSHTYTFQGSDFTWDGYYVLAKDIDATGYKHNLDNGKVYTSTSNDYNLRVFVASRVDYLAYGGGIKDRGMIGTFDGRGYVIRNLETTATGLLGFIGGTVQNVGFENCKATDNKYSFLAYGIYGSKSLIKDVYVLTTQSTVDSSTNPLISTWGQNAKVQNVIIEDRTVLNDSTRSTEYNYGSLMYQAVNDASTKTPIAIAATAYSNFYIISDKALNATVPANVNGTHTGSHTINLDAQYVDGVHASGKYYAPNVRRYTSGIEMFNDATNDYTAFNADVWDLDSGIPVFKRRTIDTLVAPVVNGSSALTVNTLIGETLDVKVLDTYQLVDADSITVTDDTATAQVIDGSNVKVGSTAGSFTLTITSGSHVFNVTVNVAIPEVLVDDVLLQLEEVPVAQGDTKTITIKAYGLLVDGVVVEPVSATNLVSISNNVITAESAGVGKIDINVKFNDIILTTFTLNILANAVDFAEEYTFSAMEGIFFDAEGNVADVLGQIEGEILAISDTEGNELTLNAEKDKVLGLKVTKAGMVKTSIYITTADTLYKINVKAATLAIDSVEDLQYFTLTESYTTTGGINGSNSMFVFGENDFKWNGYYVLVKNIDATGYTHDWTGGVAAELDTITWTQGGAVLNAMDITSYWATVGNMKEYSKNPGETTLTQKQYRGFMGVLDGQGYTISNLTTGRSGLLGLITTGSIINIGFVNNGVINNEGGFLAYGMTRGSALSNVYVSTNHNEVGDGYAPLVSKVSSIVWEFAKNSVIIDNATLPVNAVAEKMEVGSYDSNAKRWEHDHTTYGATEGDGWIWGSNHAFVVSNKPLSGYIEMNSNVITPFIDSNTVDGVKITDGVTRLRDVLDVRRYTSVEILAAAYATDAEIYKTILATGLFEIYNGIPVFKSAVGLNTVDSYNAYLDDKVVSTAVANEVFRDEVINVRVKSNGIALTEYPVTIVVNSGSDIVSVNGAQITAVATGNANITINYGSKSWTIDVLVKTPIVEYEQELTLSAMEGTLFDVYGNLFDLDQITTDTILSITDAQGNALTLTDGKVFGVKTSKTELLEDVLVITTADMIYKVSIKAATLVIDEAEDLRYFTLTESYTTTGGANGNNSILTFGEDDFKWDGYYVLVKNIDATGYVHDWTGGVAEDLDAIQYAYKSEILNVTDMWGYFATLGNVKAYGDLDNNPDTPVVTEHYRGFMGTFDGQGYTLSNLTTGKSGLFGFINGGQVKNIGFVNNQVANNNGGFLAYGVSGGRNQVTNAFVSTTHGVAGKDFAPLITKVSSKTWEVGQNTIIIDNTVLPEEPVAELTYVGSYDSNAKRWAEDHYTYGSGSGDAWQWGTTKTIIISNKPMSGYISENSTTITPFIDAHTVDGVANTNGATLLYSGMQMYRYTSMEKAIEGYATGNAAWTAIMGTGLFEIYNGIPVIKSALGLVAADNANVYLGERVVSTSAVNNITKEDVIDVRIKSNGILYTDPVATVTVNSGADIITVDGTKITAVDQGVANLTVVFGSKSWTFDINVKVPVRDYEQELILSAYDGLLFDANGNVVEISDITNQQVLSITNAQGEQLTVDNGAFVGVKAGKKVILEDVISFRTAEEVIKVNVKIVTLAIDEAEDLEYFTLTESYTTKGGPQEQYVFGENDFKWDGYYVLVKNIDATGYVHDWTGGVAAELDTVTFNPKAGVYYNAVKTMDYYANIGNMKFYGDHDKNPDTALVSIEYRGFMGVLDGQGYTLSNLTTGRSGLLGMITSGQVKNIGFVNNKVANHEGGFLAYGVTKSTRAVSNTFVSTATGVAGNGYGPLVSKISSHVWEVGYNTIIIDNTTLPEEPVAVKTYVGSYESNAARYNTDEKNIGDHDTYGSGNASAWQWGNNKAIVVSSKPLVGYIDVAKTTITPFIDAHTVDGVANDNGATLLYNGLKVLRYTSMEKAIEGYATGNDVFTSIMSTGLFEIYNGFPVIKSALGLVTADNAGAYFGERALSTTSANEITKGDVVDVRIKANGILHSNETISIVVNSGADVLSVNGSQVTATNAGNANITVSYGSKSWTYDIKVAGISVDYEKELQFSAADGLFFDGQNVVDIEDIVGDTAILGVYAADGTPLTYNDGAILGFAYADETWVENVISIKTAEATYNVKVKIAELIIDQAEDFAYFTVKKDWSRSGYGLTFADDDFVWDGYFVLAKNIDATGYNHVLVQKAGVYGTSSLTTMDQVNAFYGDSLWTQGNLRVSGVFKHGFLGCFDGQGYTISNLNTDNSGLLGIIASAKICNLGWVNNNATASRNLASFAYSILGGSVIDNVFVVTNSNKNHPYTTPFIGEWGYSTHKVTNFLVVDNTSWTQHQTYAINGYGSLARGADRYNDSCAYNFGTSATYAANWTNTTIISPMPMVTGSTPANVQPIEQNVATMDAQYIDGVLNTNKYTITYNKVETAVDPVKGVYRYNSLDKFLAFEGNNAQKYVDLGYYTLVDGFPVFTSAISALSAMELSLFVDGATVEDSAIIELEIGSTVNVVAKKLGVPAGTTITVVSGNELVTINGTKLTVNALGSAVLSIVSGTTTYTVNIEGVKKEIAYEKELTLSASEGIFFDADGNIEDVSAFLNGKTFTSISDGVSEEITWYGGKLLGAKPSTVKVGNHVEIQLSHIRFETADTTYVINAKIATLAIDSAWDLQYFTVPSGYTGKGDIKTQFVFADDEFVWDGYYVLVKNIDAAAEEYVHDWTGGTGKDLTAIIDFGSGHKLNLAECLDYFAIVGNVKDSTAKKGFMGTFDGQGHTLSNLVTGESGLFGLIQSGHVINTGFFNNCVQGNNGGFLAWAAANGRDTVKNCFVSTTTGVAGKDFAPLVSKIASHVWELGINTIIIDNTTIPTEPVTVTTQIGSYDSNAQRFVEDYGNHSYYGSGKGDTWHWAAMNAIVVSTKPMVGYIEAGSTEITAFIDAITVDDVTNTGDAAAKLQAHKDFKVRRYTSLDTLKAGIAANASLFKVYTDTGWFEIVDGMITWKGANA